MRCKKDFDLDACDVARGMQMHLIRKIAQVFVRPGNIQDLEARPRWRDFMMLWLLHRAYPVFSASQQAWALSRRLLTKLRQR